MKIPQKIIPVGLTRGNTVFVKYLPWKLHNLKPRLSSAQLRVRNARNVFSFLSEMVHISRLWFSWHGEDKIKSLDVKTTRKWLLAVHTIQKIPQYDQGNICSQVVNLKVFCSYANQKKNNFMFVICRKQVNKQIITIKFGLKLQKDCPYLVFI